MVLDINNVDEEQFVNFEKGIKRKLFSISDDINGKFIDCLVVLKQLIELFEPLGKIFDDTDIISGLQNKLHNIVNIYGKEFLSLNADLHLLIEKSDFKDLIKNIFIKQWSGKKSKDTLTEKESKILILLFGNDSIENLDIDLDTL